MGTPTKNNYSSYKTSSQVLEGRERREGVKLWKNAAESKARINLMMSLKREGLGLAELEEFNLNLGSKYRSQKFKNKVTGNQPVKLPVVEQTMKLKLSDEQSYYRELCSQKSRKRREIAKILKNNSRPFRKVMQEFKKEELMVKEELTDKFKKKVEHIKLKYRKNKNAHPEEDEVVVPDDMTDYSEARIFTKKSYDNIQEDSYEVKIVGEVELTVEERKILQLHPKFCVVGQLNETNFEHEQEAALAKIRMEITKDEENQDLTPEEIKEDEEFTARTRQVFDPETRQYDARKRRVTDLKECSRITLPRPLSPEEEATLEVRKRSQMKIFKEYLDKNTNKKGEPKTNLTPEESQGLKSLQKKISKGELIVLKTDKSSKFAVTSQEKYIEMGQEHVKKDKKITRKEIIEMEETLNGHTRAWANIWGCGQDHKHMDRIIASKTTHSENVADLYLMYKDHKVGDKTRPTATGCSSNTLGLSNAVAEVLEAVANSENKRYNMISSEDMLAKIHSSNYKMKASQQVWAEKALRKLTCIKCRIMESVDCEKTELHNWQEIIDKKNTLKEEQENLTREAEPSESDAGQEHPDQVEAEPVVEAELREAYYPAVQDLLHQECCGQDIQEELARNCEDCGPEISIWDATFSIVGSDVTALYPSIKSESTGRIIRKRLEKTSLEIEGFSVEKALAYISMNQDLTTDLQEIAHLLPNRKSGKTSKLKISAIKKEWDPRDKFEFKNTIHSNQDKKNIIARVVEIATRALFQNHGYKFGNEYYRQENGGSIGDRWTGCASEIVMQTWSEEYGKILTNSGIEVLMLAGYVDDGRQFTSSLKPGMRFDKNEKTFQYSEDGAVEDKNKKNNGESNNQRMARICQEAMNSINKDLQFTIETPEDFPNEQLPTLDFKIWQEQDQSIDHTYFQKLMKTPLVIMARSGMSVQQKIQILANELTRRISNINPKKMATQEQVKVIEQFTQELRNSQYQHHTAKEIIVSGIRGYKTRFKKRTSGGQEFYRPAHRTVSLRTRKKLLARESWYKNQEKPEAQETPHASKEAENSWKKINNKKGRQEQDKNSEPAKAVMFVPFTNGSELAKKLRENESNIKNITKHKIKIIERTGTKLQDLLTKADPWKGTDCSRENCLLCFTKQKTEKLTTQDCHKRNIVYETRCLTCEMEQRDKIEEMELEQHEKKKLIGKIKLFKYIGETSRSSFERGWEHTNDMAQLKPGSHMLKHALLNHKEQEMEQVVFGMKIIRTCTSSFERQIYESVTIQQERKEHFVLNSRSEYNRCSLPRISTQIGEQEYKKYNEELLAEKKQEEELEQMIRNIRKQRNKLRLQPAKALERGTKRRKINNCEYVTIKEIWTEKPKKNKQYPEDGTVDVERNNKRRKMEQDDLELNKQNTKTTNNKNNKEILTNCRRIEDKVMEQAVNAEDLEWEQPRDWNKMLQERKEMIEKEEITLAARLRVKERKEKGWELWKVCKELLEHMNDDWNKRKEKEQEEEARLTRLRIAREKGTRSGQRELERKQKERIQLLPKETQKKLEQEQEKARLQELKQAKESLWKLRKKEQKITETPEITAIRNLEKKHEHVETILEQQKEMLMEQEKRIRTTINVKTRNKKSKEQNENKKKKLGEIWATYRWITEYLDENNKRWEQDLENYHKLEQERIEKWNNKTRRDKVETIQQEMASGTENLHKSPIQIPNPVPIIIPAKIPDPVPREQPEDNPPIPPSHLPPSTNYEGTPPRQAETNPRKKQLKINQFITKEIKKAEINTQKPKIVKSLAPKESAKTNKKNKKKKEEEEEKQLQLKKKMKGYWSKLNERKLAEQASNVHRTDSMLAEVTPVAGRLAQTSRWDNFPVKRCTDNFTELPVPVTTGEISHSTNLKSENSTRVEESESYSDVN